MKGERIMFIFRNQDRRTPLEIEIDNLISELDYFDKSSKEYADMLGKLERLYKAKSYDTPRSISPDAKATIAANLLGIILILGYEKADIITTKALGFVTLLEEIEL